MVGRTLSTRLSASRIECGLIVEAVGSLHTPTSTVKANMTSGLTLLRQKCPSSQPEEDSVTGAKVEEQ